MKYINTKTGAIIDSPCNISGGDWKDFQEQKKLTSPVKEIENDNKGTPITQETGNEDDDLLIKSKPELVVLAEELGLGNLNKLNKLNKPEIIDKINEALNDIEDNQTEGLEG
ncbi:hypothetical protein [Erysipelothrix aquatica]|uniref:hypothetical protein n=1 Tax=Erysipelothrix aquatica TaxID=2683714 RepID=UPI00135921A2|nr:hypothetical protein [Erysipelothrix aquatica]